MERTADLSEDMETLGKAIVSLRETMEEVTSREQSRNLADRLKTIAAKRGVRTAKCEECGSKIDLGLLSSASCPVCDASFQDIDPDPGFFGRSTLETDSRPALEAPSDGPDPDEIASVASGETRSEAPDREGWFPSRDEMEGAEAGTDQPEDGEKGEDTNE